LRSKSNALNNPPALALSVVLHLGLASAIAPFFFFDPSSDSNLLPVEIFENPQQALSPSRPMPEQLPAAQPKPKTESRQVFGLSKKAIQNDTAESSEDVSLKQGNTLAATPDNKILRDSDADSIPIPTDEFLVSKMPQLLSEVRIPYPDEARKKGVQGAVTMDLLIDANGKVRQVELVGGPGAGLNEAAFQAIQQFRFKPAEVDGRPVAVRIRYAYRFVLEK
jgi:protein TonB